MAIKQVSVPDIGDFADVEIVEVHVKAGDTVAVEDTLITLETDKAAMEVPAPQAGRVVELLVAAGDKVSKGSAILTLEADAGAGADEVAGKPGPNTTAAAATSAPGTAAPPPTAAAPSGGADTIVTVAVPDIGEFSDVEVIEVLAAAGEPIEVESALITLESDKAAMDVPSTHAGTIERMHVAAGDKVSQGDPVADIRVATTGQAPARSDKAPARETAAAPKKSAPAEPAQPAVAGAGRLRALPPIQEAGFAVAYAGPSVRRLARELGVDLARVKGSGPKGRITHDDVKNWVKATLAAEPVAQQAALPAVPVVDFAKYGEVDIQPLSRIQKISGPRLHASWVNLPHVTHHDEADITDLEALRKQLKPGIAVAEAGTRLTMMTFLILACVRALKEFPGFNASLDTTADNLVYKKYYNIGFAADTPNGLVVPVIKDADSKSMVRIAKELGDLSRKAREGKLPAADMQGGTFTLSSLGGIGGTGFTPIINAPEVAILGVCRSSIKPIYRDGEFVPRLMLPLSLSYDHRVIDGAAAARFVAHLATILSDAAGFRPEGMG